MSLNPAILAFLDQDGGGAGGSDQFTTLARPELYVVYVSSDLWNQRRGFLVMGYGFRVYSLGFRV